ncbi:UDP-N-acetylmuramoyl-L-alanine--D-glutamate ligase [Nitrosospira sp. Is2]|uniref:UDP-N-acetylmuramoyl-L-alanine--D-glutamate ligase n=1 Tax=Nitrosospira sp. Is2 TaxID=3080532 RepID=UPI002954FD1D|nr:UDP-N-acetylmuramoyl-L-alanine--D-glutamate ligase [Nitrosospira sp. Is2]WON72712.1 UDP-N-acetylmuramoyl-L-alanine--D-glutamate ligase [Nitrosospira sp. Is2]
MSFREKKVLVLGMGETGLSMAKWLSRRGAEVRAADSRAVPPCMEALKRILPQVRIFTGGYPAEAFAGIDLIAISPGVPMAEHVVQQAVQASIPIMGDMELFASAIRLPGTSQQRILAITGSNGKTTVTAMVGAMVKEAGLDVEVAGNIGPAVLDALMRREDSGTLPQAWVLEVSSFQLESTRSLEPDAAAVLNVSEDHFDRYFGMQDYAAAKARIFTSTPVAGKEGGGIQILNRDDPVVRAMAVAERKQMTFGLDQPSNDNDLGLLHESGSIWLAQGGVRLMQSSELRVTGLHNVANALAALALCRAVDLPSPPLLRALRQFQGLPHRMEKVATLGGVTFYDDSKGTNVGATVAALDGMRQSVVLIAGGDGKGQDFTPLAGPIARHARAVVLIGRDADKIGAAIDHCRVPLYYMKTMEEAVQKSFELARAGDAVMMSPACASLDMFRNYAHRAEVFIAAVRSLQAGKTAAAQTTVN